MKRTDAEKLARSLMDAHGLHHVPFKWTRAKRTLGVTKFTVTRLPGFPAVATVQFIGLSTEYVDLLPEPEIRDVILHEIAHAIAGHKAGHGPVWKATARRVGAKPNRCATPSAQPKGVITGVCPKGHTFEVYRMPQRVKFCSKCRGPFDKSRVLTWLKGGVPVPVESMPQKFQMEAVSLKNRGRI